MLKKVIAFSLAVLVLSSSPVLAQTNSSNTAVDIIIDGDSPSIGYDEDGKIDDTGRLISVTVPSVLPIIFNSDGSTTTPTNFVIKSYDSEDIRVDNMWLEVIEDDWSVHQVDDDATPGEFFLNKGHNYKAVEMLVNEKDSEFFASLADNEDDNKVKDLWLYLEADESAEQSILALEFRVYRGLFTEAAEGVVPYSLHIDFSFVMPLFDKYGPVYSHETLANENLRILAGDTDAEDIDIDGSRYILVSSVVDEYGLAVMFGTDYYIDDELVCIEHGKEYAIWDEDYVGMYIWLERDRIYYDEDIQRLIDSALIPEGTIDHHYKIIFKSEQGALKGGNALIGFTGYGARQTIGTESSHNLMGIAADGSANTLVLVNNSYGGEPDYDSQFFSVTLRTDATVGTEFITVEDAPSAADLEGSDITLHVAVGVEYSVKDIERLLSQSIEYWSGAPWARTLNHDYSAYLYNSDGSPSNIVVFSVPDTSVRIEQSEKGAGVDKRWFTDYVV